MPLIATTAIMLNEYWDSYGAALGNSKGERRVALASLIKFPASKMAAQRCAAVRQWFIHRCALIFAWLKNAAMASYFCNETMRFLSAEIGHNSQF